MTKICIYIYHLVFVWVNSWTKHIPFCLNSLNMPKFGEGFSLWHFQKVRTALKGQKPTELLTFPSSLYIVVGIFLSSTWENGEPFLGPILLTESFPFSRLVQTLTNLKTPQETNHTIVKGLIATDHLVFLPELRQGPKPCGSHIVFVNFPKSLTLRSLGSLSQQECLCKWWWGELAINKHFFQPLFFLCSFDNSTPQPLRQLVPCSRIANS